MLDGLEWGEGLTLEDLGFLVVDRGVPGDKRLVGAPEVVGRDRSYLKLAGGGSIPFHRILEVRVGERVVWRKRGFGGEGAPGQ